MTPTRARREQLRVPKEQLAARLGLDPYDLSRIEYGSAPVSIATLATIAVLLQTDARALGAHECGCGCGELAAPGRRFRHGHDNTKGPQAKRVWQARRRALGIPETKVCEGCGDTYTRRKRENTRKWLKRRWCTAACWRESPICRTAPHQRRWDSVRGGTRL